MDDANPKLESSPISVIDILSGVALVDDPSLMESVRQITGFTPSQITEAYRRNSALKNAEQTILTRRTRLLERYNRALTQQDREKVMVILKEIMAFNRQYSEKGISNKTLRQSTKARERAKINQEGGVHIAPDLAPRLRKGYRQLPARESVQAR